MRAVTHLFLGLLFIAGILGTASLYRREVRFQTVLLEQAVATGRRLNSYNEQLEQLADANAQHIGYEVHRNQNQARDLELLRQTEEITRSADSLATAIKVTVMLNCEPVAPVSNFIVPIAGPPANSNAPSLSQLAKQLTAYQTLIRQYAPATQLIPQTEQSAVNSRWLEQQFYSFSYEAAAAASLTQLLTSVRRAELAALEVQARKMSSCCFCYDRIGVVAVPVSATVAPGSVYRAQLFFGLSSSSFHYNQMSVDGQKVLHIENGQGLVEIPIPKTLNGLPDTISAKWSGTIRTDLYPADSTWHLTVPFFVVKPSRR